VLPTNPLPTTPTFMSKLIALELSLDLRP
jgi:hypothetical protein